ncbi:hypothetical protein ABZX65_09880 [Streptomyces sp. NPDC003300]|uniref:hypothetical protein n=1 Tax=unclassified Streptomyces TaxID=2593676 RepID=UPI0033A6D51D
MTLGPVTAPRGEEGFDYIDLCYPTSDVTSRYNMITGTYPPRAALTPRERAMFAYVATMQARCWYWQGDPLASLLTGREAAVCGHDDAVDYVARSTLGFSQAKAASWREAVSTALLGDWVPLLGEEDASLIVPRHVKREASRVHRQLKPLWEHQAGGRRVALLNTPIADGLTLGDLVAAKTRPDADLLPEIETILMELGADELDVALAWARDPAIRSWAEAARSTGAPNPEKLGERVRRKLRRLGDKYAKGTARAQEARP